jgi:hypothetical protein
MSRYYRIEIDGGPTRLPADVCAGMAARRTKEKAAAQSWFSDG